MDQSAGRRYGGKTADERRAERRLALMGAAKDIWRERGLAAVTVRAVTAQAGLTDRYFYEQFTDLGQLITAAVDETFEGSFAAMIAAGGEPESASAQTRFTLGLAAFVDHAMGDPLTVRIFHTDERHLPAVAAYGRMLQHRVAAAILSVLHPDRDAQGPDFEAALFCVGGVTTLMNEWITSPDHGSPAEFATRAVALCNRILDAL